MIIRNDSILVQYILKLFLYTVQHIPGCLRRLPPYVPGPIGSTPGIRTQARAVRIVLFILFVTKWRWSGIVAFTHVDHRLSDSLANGRQHMLAIFPEVVPRCTVPKR